MAVVVAGAIALLATAWSGNASPAASRLSGQTVRVVAVWSGEEQASFEAVLHAFERATGAHVEYTSAGHDIKAFLDRLIAAGRAPDVAFVPQPGLLQLYARRHRLVPLDAEIGAEVARNYAPVWTRLGSVDRKLYGVWFKAANKSLVWYNLAPFEQLGAVPPDDLRALISLAEELTQNGIPAFCVAGADGWTLTDWFENVYIRTAGPRRYDLLASHRIPWTDPSVKSALGLLGRLLTPATMAGGTEGALDTSFEASVKAASQRPAACAMVFEGDFVAGLLGDEGARLGIDIDVFPFPARAGSTPAVIGGGDAAVQFRRSAAGTALVRFLAGTQAAAIWASAGGFISPNLNVDLTVYPDATTRGAARGIIEAGDNFRFDLSDQLPAVFGAVEGGGIRKALQDFLVNRDVEATAARLEEEAAAASRVDRRR